MESHWEVAKGTCCPGRSDRTHGRQSTAGIDWKRKAVLDETSNMSSKAPTVSLKPLHSRPLGRVKAARIAIRCRAPGASENQG